MAKGTVTPAERKRRDEKTSLLFFLISLSIWQLVLQIHFLFNYRYISIQFFLKLLGKL